MHGASIDQLSTQIHEAQLLHPSATLYAISQPALDSGLQWLARRGTSVFAGSSEDLLAPQGAYVTELSDVVRLRAHYLSGAHRASLWMCLSELGESQLARHFYKMAQVRDQEGGEYLLRWWDAMVLRHMKLVLSDAQHAELMWPTRKWWMPESGWWLMGEIDARPKKSESLHLTDEQINALAGIAEQGQVVGFARERMPAEAAVHDEHKLFELAERALRAAISAGYESVSDAMVFMMAYLKFGLFDEMPGVGKQLSLAQNEGLDVGQAIARYLECQ